MTDQQELTYAVNVDWTSPLSTLLGAAIGITSPLTVDRLRWRRARHDRQVSAKLETYARYLAALSSTRNELRLAARTNAVEPADRARIAAEAFKVGGAYELRYQVAISAPANVIDTSDRAFRALRDLRDLVESGKLRTDQEYRDQSDRWEKAFARLRQQVRDDLEQSY
jgi:hypothetical protein